MKAMNKNDVEFLPMNIPYTITPEKFADWSKGFKPAILYPYHYGDTNLEEIQQLMSDEPEVELRMRKF